MVKLWDEYNIGWWRKHFKGDWDARTFYLSLEDWQKDRIRYLRAFGATSRHLIDIGCGPWELFYIKNTPDTIGVDISKAALLNLKKLGFIGSLIVADCRHLPFKHKGFDHAICSEVIEHMASKEEVIRLIEEIRSISENVIITTPNSNFRLKIRDPTHFFFFTTKDLKRILPDFKIYRSNVPPKNIVREYIPYDSPKLRRFIIGRFIAYIFQKIDSSNFISILSARLWGGTHLVAIKIKK